MTRTAAAMKSDQNSDRIGPALTELSPFEQNVRSRFGLLPNFFASAPDAPEIVERLWDFAKSAYIDNPIPSLFKERLFVCLSRYCEVRYCIVRHCAFLVGHGHSAGDPSAPDPDGRTGNQTVEVASPWNRDEKRDGRPRSRSA